MKKKKNEIEIKSRSLTILNMNWIIYTHEMK